MPRVLASFSAELLARRGGGADGSIAVFNATELTFHANTGIDDVLDTVGPFLQKWSHVMTPGDL